MAPTVKPPNHAGVKSSKHTHVHLSSEPSVAKKRKTGCDIKKKLGRGPPIAMPMLKVTGGAATETAPAVGGPSVPHQYRNQPVIENFDRVFNETRDPGRKPAGAPVDRPEALIAGRDTIKALVGKGTPNLERYLSDDGPWVPSTIVDSRASNDQAQESRQD